MWKQSKQCSGVQGLQYNLRRSSVCYCKNDPDANEARCVYKKRRMNLPEKDTEFPKVARRKSLEKWQQHWDGSRGRSMGPRIQRRNGEINWHLTQFLSGHSSYRQYLHRFGLDNSPFCPECGCPSKELECIIFYCPRSSSERSREDFLKISISCQNIIGEMLKLIGNWCTVNSAIKRNQVELRKAECTKSGKVGRS